jgi:hypothetical protein
MKVSLMAGLAFGCRLGAVHALAYRRFCSWSKQLFIAPLRHEVEPIVCLERFR